MFGDLVGDLTNDDRVDLQDAEALQQAELAGDMTAVLTGDDQVDVDDVLFLVEDIIGTSIGDVNGDNVFNSLDLVRLFQVGGYEDGIAGNGTYLGGDWNLDGDFSSEDLILALQTGGYVRAAVDRAIEDF